MSHVYLLKNKIKSLCINHCWKSTWGLWQPGLSLGTSVFSRNQTTLRTLITFPPYTSLLAYAVLSEARCIRAISPSLIGHTVLREVSRQGEDCESHGSPGRASKDGMFGSAPFAVGEKQSELARPPALSFTNYSFGARACVCPCPVF